MASRYEELLLPEQRDRDCRKSSHRAQVERAAVGEDGQRFQRCIQGGKPIPGFNNDPLKAQVPMLKQHILERLGLEPSLEQLIVGAWTDTESQLRVAINEHISTAWAGISMTPTTWTKTSGTGR